MSTARPRRATSSHPSDLAAVWPERPPITEKDHLAVVAPVPARAADDLTGAARGALRYGLTSVGLAPGRRWDRQDTTPAQLAVARAAAREVLDALGVTS